MWWTDIFTLMENRQAVRATEGRGQAGRLLLTVSVQTHRLVPSGLQDEHYTICGSALRGSLLISPNADLL